MSTLVAIKTTVHASRRRASRAIDWLEQRSSARLVGRLLAAELAVLSVENLLYFPLSVPYMRENTGQAYLDFCAFCSGAQVQQQLLSMGPLGRRLQAWLLLSVDVLIPLLSTALGCFALLHALKLRGARPAARAWLLIPLAAGLLDFLENASIALLLARFPAPDNLLASLAGIITGLKFAAYGMSVLVVPGLSVLARRRSA